MRCDTINILIVILRSRVLRGVKVFYRVVYTICRFLYAKTYFAFNCTTVLIKNRNILRTFCGLYVFLCAKTGIKEGPLVRSGVYLVFDRSITFMLPFQPGVYDPDNTHNTTIPQHSRAFD